MIDDRDAGYLSQSWLKNFQHVGKNIQNENISMQILPKIRYDIVKHRLYGRRIRSAFRLHLRGEAKKSRRWIVRIRDLRRAASADISFERVDV